MYGKISYNTDIEYVKTIKGKVADKLDNEEIKIYEIEDEIIIKLKEIINTNIILLKRK